mgnify:CR=1 FL=1
MSNRLMRSLLCLLPALLLLLGMASAEELLTSKGRPSAILGTSVASGAGDGAVLRIVYCAGSKGYYDPCPS